LKWLGKFLRWIAEEFVEKIARPLDLIKVALRNHKTLKLVLLGVLALLFFLAYSETFFQDAGLALVALLGLLIMFGLVVVLFRIQTGRSRR